MGLTCKMQATEFHLIILMSSIVTLDQNNVLLINKSGFISKILCKHKMFHLH